MLDFWAKPKEQSRQKQKTAQDVGEIAYMKDFTTEVRPLISRPFSVLGSRLAVEEVYIKGQKVIGWGELGDTVWFLCGRDVGTTDVGIAYAETQRPVFINEDTDCLFYIQSAKFDRVLQKMPESANFVLGRKKIDSDDVQKLISKQFGGQTTSIRVQRSKAEFHKWLVQAQKDAIREMRQS